MISKLFLFGAAVALSFTAVNSQAQEYHRFGHSYGHTSAHLPPLGQNVYLLDQYATQMNHFYSLEAARNCRCAHTAALLGEIRRYNACTRNLVVAYHGTCPTAFHRAACSVRDSLNRVEALQSRVRVSHQVRHLISQSCPMSSYVHSHHTAFQPAPVHNPHYRQYRPASNCDRGLDVGSAIFGAVAGRIIHGIVHGH